jgi:hypothetical protein
MCAYPFNAQISLLSQVEGDIRRVPGHHHTMLRKPNASILANSLGHLFASINNEDHYAVVKD